MQLLILLLLLFVSATCFSQEHNNVWHFGNHAGLNFNNGDPQPIKGKLVHYNNTASVSDLEGKLLFYSDGKSVWDRNHNVMPNGNELTGGILALQPALIIPFPASYLKFFLFTSEGISTNGGLSYSIVDMTLNDSYGDIISGYKNILVKDSTQHTVAAILHPNQIDIWIITYLRNSNEFLSYLVTSSGIEIEPVISQVNSSLLLDPFYGSIKTSHNGLRIALHTHSNTFEVFDFNPLTGSISDATIYLIPSAILMKMFMDLNSPLMTACFI